MHSHLWRAHTVAVLVTVALAGCADSDTPTDEQTASAPDAAPTAPATSPEPADTGEDKAPTDGSEDAVQVVEVAITGGRAHTDSSRVDVTIGTVVRVEVRADVVEEVHVHGYDLVAPVSPGQPAVLEFAADIPGVFEVEAEHSGLELFQLRVR